MSSRERYTAIGHRGMDFAHPVGAGKVDDALSRLGLNPGDRAIDFGCGQGEALVRLATRYGAGAVGVDRSEFMLQEARRRRAAAGLADERVRFERTDASAFLDTLEGAQFRAALCIGSTHVFGGMEGTLTAISRCLAPGGRVLLGESFWQKPPDPAYLEALSLRENECRRLPETVAAAERAGFRVIWLSVASEDDWNAYEWGLAYSLETWFADHPDDEGAAEQLARSRRWRDGALRWGRQTFGFGLFLLVRTTEPSA